MGATPSSTARVLGVPMPPTAWALASVWSEIWEAPRFRNQTSAALKREAVTPLLKLAASCVAVLQRHITAADRKSRLPLQGASRELLVTALDSGLEVAGLPDPTSDPAGFVRAVVRAAFTTGDGDLIEGLSSEDLDRLLQEHCATQLEHAGLLVRDPSGALQAALNEATAKVGEVLALPPPSEGNLVAVADRLLLAQRLERIAQEATHLLDLAAAPVVEEPAEAPPEVVDIEIPPAEEGQQPETIEDGASHAGAETSLERTQTLVSPTSEAKKIIESSEVETSAEKPPERTRSQVAASLKVQTVKTHVDASRQPIHELQRAVSQIAKKSLPEDDELEALQSELDAIEQARKRARNFGEDLLEDMLALDALGNLTDEDRHSRKASLAGIEALLSDVDAAKSRLSALHQTLEAKLKAARAARAAQSTTTHDDGSTEEPEDDLTSRTSVAESPPRAVPIDSSNGAHPQKKRAAMESLAIEAPPPKRADWQQVRLPLRFHSREEQDHYIVLATIPGLDTEELKLELSDDNMALTVEGLKVPTRFEAFQMQQKISSRLRALAQHSPQHFAALRKDLGRICSKAYVELGQGEFGRFKEVFHVPEDVDASGIDASYRDGVLRILLPKVPVVPAVPWLANSSRSRFGSGRRAAVPAGFPAMFRRAPPTASAPDLFGGIDRNYYW